MPQPRVRRLFQILPGEGNKVLCFALLAGLLQAGVAIGMVAADSLFLAKLGVEKLPLIFIFMPVVMAIYAPIYSFLVGALGSHGLFRLTLLLLVVGGLFFGFAGDTFGDAPWYLFAMRFYAGLWFIAVYTLFWNFADDYFSILDSKRLYGLISAGSAAGTILGGGLISVLSTFMPASALFMLWSVMALLTWPVFALVLRRFKPIASDDSSNDESTSLTGMLRFAAGSLSSSRFALLLAVLCFMGVALSAALDYMAMGVFAENRSADELAGLLGGLYALAGVLTLVINLFFFNRIVGRLGVATVTLIVPLAYVGAFILFFLHPGELAAVVAFFMFQSLFVSIDNNNINLLYNALPARMKRQLRTFIEAMAEPAATATAGLLLLYSAGVIDPSNLALAGLLAACVGVLIAALIRHDYSRALASNLRADWLDFANPDEGWQRQLSADDLTLLTRTAESGTREQRLLAVDLLWRLQDPAARGELLNFLSDATAAEAERLRPAIAGVLRQDDTETLAETLLWLESDRAPSDPDVLEEFTGSGAFPVRQFESWRNSTDPAHQAALAVARWNGSRLDDVARAVAEIRTLLQGDLHSRRMALRAIGDCRHSRYCGELLPFLDSDQPLLRLEALRSTRKLASPDTTQLLPQVLPLLRNGATEERLLILDIAGRTGDTTAIQPLIWAAEHFSSNESRRLEEVIRGMGLKAIPGVMHVLRDPSAPYHSRSIAMRTLSRLAMPQLLMVSDELINGELAHAEQALLSRRSLQVGSAGASGVGQTVLIRYYRDVAAQGLEFALELLSLGGRLPDFDLIRATLSFANPRDRANAIETIQQSCSRAVFTRLSTLIDATVPGIGLDIVHSGAPLSVDVVLQRAAMSDVPLEASAGMIAHQELGLPGTVALLRARLDQLGGGGRVGDWLAGLLPQFAAGKGDSAPLSHPVERLASLIRAEFFGDARILALNYLTQHALDKHWEPGEVIYEDGADASDMWVIAEGNVELLRPNGPCSVGAGSTFGQRVLMGENQRQERAVSAGCRTLTLSCANVTRAIEIFPTMGVSLFQFKTISSFS